LLLIGNVTLLIDLDRLSLDTHLLLRSVSASLIHLLIVSIILISLRARLLNWSTASLSISTSYGLVSVLLLVLRRSWTILLLYGSSSLRLI
jgi:hypothetical protein